MSIQSAVPKAGAVVADDHPGSARIVNGEPGPVPIVDPTAEIARVRILDNECAAVGVRVEDGRVAVAWEQARHVRTNVVGEGRRPEIERAAHGERVDGRAGIDELVLRPDRDTLVPKEPCALD
jgi:hypothetical protein